MFIGREILRQEDPRTVAVDLEEICLGFSILGSFLSSFLSSFLRQLSHFFYHVGAGFMVCTDSCLTKCLHGCLGVCKVLRFANPFIKLSEALMHRIDSDIFGITATTERFSVVVRHSTILECHNLSKLEVLTLTSVTPKCETNRNVVFICND